MTIRAFLRLRIQNAGKRGIVCLLTLAIFGCTIYRPHSPVDLNSLPQARTQSDGQVRITAAVLTAEESKEIFAVPVYDSGVQPLWLSIDNHDHVPYAFLPVSVDQNMFSPLEAAYRNHYRLFVFANAKMDAHFLQNAIPRVVPPGSTVSGFVFTNKDLGAKYTQIQLVGPRGTKPKLLSFLLPVPGFATQYDALLVSERYKQEEISYDDERDFREALERLPCCTTNEDGTVQGDPINIVLVGDKDDIFSSFFDRQWDLAEEVDLASSWKETRSFLFRTSFRHAPASSLYVFGRQQDVTIQRPRATIEARDHVRLWRAPMRFEGKPVWVGQVSRDIGVRFTLATWNLATHRIDPHVDHTRDYVVEDLFRSHMVTKVAYVRGGEVATLASPRKNLTGDPYITDGLRAVLVFSHSRVSDSEMQASDWELPSNKQFREQQNEKSLQQR
jgi:hypothetical protein